MSATDSIGIRESGHSRRAAVGRTRPFVVDPRSSPGGSCPVTCRRTLFSSLRPVPERWRRRRNLLLSDALCCSQQLRVRSSRAPSLVNPSPGTRQTVGPSPQEGAPPDSRAGSRRRAAIQRPPPEASVRELTQSWRVASMQRRDRFIFTCGRRVARPTRRKAATSWQTLPLLNSMTREPTGTPPT